MRHHSHEHRKKSLMLILFNLLAEQSRHADAHLTELVISGAVREAVEYGKRKLESPLVAADTSQRAAVGRVVGRALLSLGREVEAEELFQRQHRLYCQMSGDEVRRLASLDQAAMTLSLHRLGRAAQSATTVIDDAGAAPALRVEGLLLLAECLHHLGEFDSAGHALAQASELSADAGLICAGRAVDLLRLDQLVRRTTRPSVDRGHRALCLGHASATPSFDASYSTTSQALLTCVGSFAGNELMQQRIVQLRALLQAAQGAAAAEEQLCNALKWVHDRGLIVTEDRLRIDAAMACTSGNLIATSERLLRSLASDPGRIGRHRFAPALHYCVACVHETGGRLAQALSAYSEHAAESTRLLRCELLRTRLPRCVIDRCESGAVSTDALRLPSRYRVAHRYIVEHLSDSTLNVPRVAAAAGVTPRMLQMAFREHLGVTPAALIRRLRIQHIQADFAASRHSQAVLHVAARWGITNRSTITRGLKSASAAAG
jgi:AraC-like DNA-binding protein